ncbi:chorion peroxidase-like [Anopheles darlingi]|uniref:chorion peroxidase-like n=1 Tax=Anopheles darlingi TaxID=43151 RepID=UPI00210048AE|nr:chorion peroxidase-like [Anopheles darlingi]
MTFQENSEDFAQVLCELACSRRCPNLECFNELEKEAYIKAVAELLSNEEKSKCDSYLISQDEFDHNFFKTDTITNEEHKGVEQTLFTEKFLKFLVQKVGKCPVKNLLEGKCAANVTLTSCLGEKQIKCNPDYPYRTYDGTCNNLHHATWGSRGRPLKHPIAPCYSDVVSKPARSIFNAPLPQNRKLVRELASTLEKTGARSSAKISMFLVFLSELVNTDMIGRATRRVRNPTGGFRGCTVDGSDRSACVSTLSNPLRVLPKDDCFDPIGVGCLNFSPQEKSNDQCELKHVGQRNAESSYLDLSNVYGTQPSYDANGKLELFTCGGTKPIVESSPSSVQFFALGGLFAQLHNYCVDQVRSCGQSKGPVEERCRAFTIGVYQKIIYEQLLPFLFGEQFYAQCGFDCEYNPEVEASVSQLYKSAVGRFQHIWIPKTLNYIPNGDRRSLPFHEFFHNEETFDCNGILAGVVESPISINRFTDEYQCLFYSEDGKRGTCLACIDLARNREAGLCPLLTYKHYIEELFGDNDSSKCYSKFEDLEDIFRPEIIELFENMYDSPADIDAYFCNLDRRFHSGASLPKLVAQATCLEFKRLKCTDRFFYTRNPNLGEGARKLITNFDLTVLLSLFTNLREVPIQPLVSDSTKVESAQVRAFSTDGGSQKLPSEDLSSSCEAHSTKRSHETSPPARKSLRKLSVSSG